MFKSLKKTFKNLGEAFADAASRIEPAMPHPEPEPTTQPAPSLQSVPPVHMVQHPCLSQEGKVLLRITFSNIWNVLPAQCTLGVSVTAQSVRISEENGFVIFKIGLPATHSLTGNHYASLLNDLNNASNNMVDDALAALRNRIYSDAYRWSNEVIQHFDIEATFAAWSARASYDYLDAYRIFYGYNLMSLLQLNVVDITVAGNVLKVHCKPRFNECYVPKKYWENVNAVLAGYCI